MIAAYDLVENELYNLGVRIKKKGTNIFIQCPFHSERTPSCSINVYDETIPPGAFFCFGCGEKGKWNYLASQFGLKELSKLDMKVLDSSQISDDIKHRLLPNKSLNSKHLLPRINIPFNKKSWRKISGHLVKEVGGVLSFDDYSRETKLWFSIKVKGKEEAIIAAKLYKNTPGGGEKYYVFGGPNKSKFAIFPYDYTVGMIQREQHGLVFIVEGPRDALFLMQNGIPALAILGTQQWSTIKRKLIKSLCDKEKLIPVVMFDGDKAGKSSQTKIYSSLKEVFITVKQINLTSVRKKLKLEELDPATLPIDFIGTLKKLDQKYYRRLQI